MLQSPRQKTSDAARQTVFVVDDESQVRNILERMLLSFGYAVETFASAREFLDRPTFQGEGCLLLDIQMPGMDGMELQQALAEAGSTIPIIFITAYADFTTCIAAIKKGAADYITKPFNQLALLNAVRSALEKNRERLNAPGHA